MHFLQGFVTEVRAPSSIPDRQILRDSIYVIVLRVVYHGAVKKLPF